MTISIWKKMNFYILLWVMSVNCSTLSSSCHFFCHLLDSGLARIYWIRAVVKICVEQLICCQKCRANGCRAIAIRAVHPHSSFSSHYFSCHLFYFLFWFFASHSALLLRTFIPSVKCEGFVLCKILVLKIFGRGFLEFPRLQLYFWENVNCNKLVFFWFNFHS